ncbi:MAG: hypothetical protein SV062_14765 [Thermodesulfobacteriota bacterium]|nr:hypothetical protein [Thermodesulfobacteriota bacterium]
MTYRKRMKVWVAVRVERGFPAEVKGYLQKTSAEKQERLWRRKINLDYDDTDVFDIIIEKKLKKRTCWKNPVKRLMLH